MQIRIASIAGFIAGRSAPAALFLAAIALCAPQLAIGANPQSAPTAHDKNEGPPAEAVETLRKHGQFFTHPKWGGIWRPQQSSTWRPYTFGRWAKRAEGTMEWVSDEPFGDTVYHYGRWSFDPDQQWIWIPGSNRAPAWVAWRQNDRYVGWAPLPPTPESAQGRDIPRTDIYDAPEFSNYWVFAPTDRWMALNLKDYLIPQATGTKLTSQTKPVKVPAALTRTPPGIAQYDEDLDEPGQSVENEPDEIGDTGPVERDYAQTNQDRDAYENDGPIDRPTTSLKDSPLPAPQREAYRDDYYADDEYYEDDDYDDAYYDDYDYDDAIVYGDIYPHFQIFLADTHPYYQYYYYPYRGAPPRYFGPRRSRPSFHKRFRRPGLRARSPAFKRERRLSRQHDITPRRTGPRLNDRARLQNRGGARNRASGRDGARNPERSGNRGGARNRGNALRRGGDSSRGKARDVNRGGARNENRGGARGVNRGGARGHAPGGARNRDRVRGRSADRIRSGAQNRRASAHNGRRQVNNSGPARQRGDRSQNKNNRTATRYR